MHCTKCGKRIEGQAQFCVNCGAPLSSNGAPGQKQKRVSGAAIAAAAAACVAVIALAATMLSPGNVNPKPSASAGGSAQVSSTTAGSATGSSSSADAVSASNSPSSSLPEPTVAEPSAEELAMQTLDGWWQSVGQSQSVFRHFSNGTVYIYQRDYNDRSVFSYVNTDTYTVEPFEAGALSFTDEAGFAVHVSNGGTYIFMNSEPGVLTSRKMDGSDYSGSGSMTRPEPGEVTETLLALAEECEAN